MTRTKGIRYVILAGIVLGVGLAAGAAEKKQAEKKEKETNVLTAVKVKTAPKPDGKMDDVWKQAKPLTVKVIDGANLPGGETEVRHAYDADVHFLKFK